MSKIFFDHLVIFEEVEVHIKNIATTQEEREELWHLVDGIVQTRVVSLILDHLPQEHHQEFIDRLHKAPHDERHIHWLNERVQRNIEDVIREEIKLLEKEIKEEMLIKKP